MGTASGWMVCSIFMGVGMAGVLNEVVIATGGQPIHVAQDEPVDFSQLPQPGPADTAVSIHFEQSTILGYLSRDVSQEMEQSWSATVEKHVKTDDPRKWTRSRITDYISGRNRDDSLDGDVILGAAIWLAANGESGGEIRSHMAQGGAHIRYDVLVEGSSVRYKLSVM